MIKVNTYILEKLSFKEKSKLIKRANSNIKSLEKVVAPILKEIQNNGKKALIHYTSKFDNVTLNAKAIKVTKNEILQAKKTLSLELLEVMNKSFINIQKFHKIQMPKSIWWTEIDNGVMAGEKTTPIPSVGMYIPKGKGTFSQLVLRLGVPAKVAGVKNIIICTPPTKDGMVDPATLVAADMIGIKNIFKVGGAQAIACMAYGIENIIPKVDKIVGPGNEYVVAAKSLLHGIVDVGIPAGISEAIILADEHADPYNVTLDWLIEAEHGPYSPSLLVTHSKKLAAECEKLLPSILKYLPDESKKHIISSFTNYSGIVITPSLEHSIKFINEYAPEHLEIMTDEPTGILNKIKNAGEILLGKFAPISIANFSLGPSAVLPTGGFAKTFSGVSVYDFLKRTSLGYLTKEGFLNVSFATDKFATHAGLAAHAIAVSKRNI